jgi:PAS domain S-box-containing protein
VISVVATATVVAMRFALMGSSHGDDSFLPFVPGTVLAAWVGGVGPGLLATLLGAAVQCYTVIPPTNSIRVSEPRDLVRLGLFVLIGATLSGLCRSLRVARQQYIAEKKRLAEEETLRRGSERLLRLVNDHAPVYLVSCDAQRYLYVNRQYAARFGKEPADLVGQRVETIVGPQIYQRIKPHIDEVMRGKPAVFEAELMLSDMQRPQHLRCAYEPVTDERGQVSGYIGALVDLTDRTVMERQLRQAAERLRLALTAAGMLAWEWDLRSGKIRLVGESGHQAGGTTPTLPSAEQTWRLVHPADVEDLRRTVGDAIATRSSFAREFRMMRPGRNVFVWLEVHGAVSCDAAGEPQTVGGVVVNITRRKSAAEEVERAALLVQNSDDFIAMCDMNFTPIFCNRAGLQLVGLDDLETLQRTKIQKFFFPEDQEMMMQEFFPRVLREGRGQIEVRFRHFKTAEPIWMKYNVLVVKDSRGDATGFATISENITQQKLAQAERAQVEQALRVSRERMDLVVNSTGLGLWYCDLPFDKLVWNDKCKEHFGLPREAQVTFDLFLERLHPEDREATREAIVRAIASRSTFDGQYRTVSPDGRIRWIRAIGHTGCDPRGVVTRFDGITVDITAQKRAEQSLRESESYFRSMADNAPALLWVAAPTGERTYLSRQWYEFTGRSAEEDLGMGWLQNVHPGERETVHQSLIDARASRIAFSCDYRLRRRDGEYRWVVDTGLPRFDPDGVYEGHIGCVIDVHDRKTFEEALKEADRRKDEFLATLAHELRNPLAPIRNSVNVLKARRDGDDETAWAQDVIDRQVQQMARLLDDLLDVSRITRGKLELRRKPVKLNDIVQIAVETSRPLIDASGHSLEVAIPEDPITLDADQTRLAQAISNLLNNAAKYTEPGGQIRLTARRLGGDVLLCVKDNGIGIAPEMLPSVFGMFTQLDSSRERTQGGLGIGLTLVKRLVEMHGGTIDAQSDGPGLGSEFTIRIPTTADSPRAVEPEPWSGASRSSLQRKILVADDNRDAARSLSLLLRHMGNDVRIANDGVEAVEAAAEFKPDVALLDIGMPRMNGYDAARQIRKQSSGRGVVLVALTGWGQEEDKRLSVEAGFDHHIVKPLELKLLQTLLERVSPRSSAEPAPQHEAPAD